MVLWDKNPGISSYGDSGDGMELDPVNDMQENLK